MDLLKYDGLRAPAKISNGSSLVECVRNIRKKIGNNERLSAMIKSSCFGDIILGIQEGLQFSSAVVHNLLLREVKSPNDDDIRFLIRGSILSFDANEFARITRLKMGDAKTLELTGSNSISNELFRGRTMIKKIHIKQKFLSVKTEDLTLLLKLSLIYFLELGLLGSAEEKLIDVSHLCLVDDLSKFNNYPWGTICFGQTLSSLKKALKPYQKINAPYKSREYHISGCPLVIQVWAYDCITELGKNWAEENDLSHKRNTPTLIKWTSKTGSFQGVAIIYDSKEVFNPCAVKSNVPESLDLVEQCNRLLDRVSAMRNELVSFKVMIINHLASYEMEMREFIAEKFSHTTGSNPKDESNDEPFNIYENPLAMNEYVNELYED